MPRLFLAAALAVAKLLLPAFATGLAGLWRGAVVAGLGRCHRGEALAVGLDIPATGRCSGWPAHCRGPRRPVCSLRLRRRRRLLLDWPMPGEIPCKASEFEPFVLGRSAAGDSPGTAGDSDRFCSELIASTSLVNDSRSATHARSSIHLLRNGLRGVLQAGLSRR